MAIKITDTDIQLFKTMASFRLLTARQAAYILERNGKATHRRLKVLQQMDMVRNHGAHMPQFGSGRPGDVYGLAEAGVRCLVKHGKLDGKVNTGLVTGDAVSDQMVHQYLINTFRIGLSALRRQAPEFAIRGISSNSPFDLDPGSGRPLAAVTVSPEPGEPDCNPVRFIPDYVFQICSEERSKSLLFFVEADTGSEPLSSADPEKPNIDQKLCNYQAYFRSEDYKCYEGRWQQTFNGFRLLFLCADPSRAQAVAKAVRKNSSLDFVWVTSIDALMADGVSGEIWYRGGHIHTPPQSILGSLARRAPIEL